MIHLQTERRWTGDDVGLGLFATEFMPRGTIVWVRDPHDIIISAAAVEAMALPLRKRVERFAFHTGSGRWVLCWDDARFMNHSCAPNVGVIGDSFEIALRDIAAGEELVVDYGIYELREYESFLCCCGSTACRGTIPAGYSKAAQSANATAVHSVLRSRPVFDHYLERLVDPAVWDEQVLQISAAA
jgi:uncharacterized protein